MLPLRILVLLTLVFSLRLGAQVTSARCGAARDLMVRALERVSPDSPPPVILDANELLKRSERMCSELGDAWYYRSLFEKRLGNPDAARFSLSQATRLGSAALTENLDPFVLATKPGTPAPPLTGGARWALVIGVSHFADPNIPPLKYTADDARLFADALTDPGVAAIPHDHIRVLVENQATTAAIRSNLNWIARSAKPEDIVVIYVATHGSARDLDSVGGANYLITSDTVVGPNQDQDLLFGSALAMNDLVATVVNRISAQRTAIFIDTCYSGSTQASGRGESVSARDLSRFGQGQGRIIMTAARSDQESLESDRFHHGYFTWFLVQALRTPESVHTLSSIYAQVSRNVSDNVLKDTSPMSVHQDPVLSRSTDSTDFSLTTR